VAFRKLSSKSHISISYSSFIPFPTLPEVDIRVCIKQTWLRVLKLLLTFIRKRTSPEKEDPNKPRKYRGTQKTANLYLYLLFSKDVTVEVSCDVCGLARVDEKPASWETDPRFILYKANFLRGLDH
jgi:hypothetical protein